MKKTANEEKVQQAADAMGVTPEQIRVPEQGDLIEIIERPIIDMGTQELTIENGFKRVSKKTGKDMLVLVFSNGKRTETTNGTEGSLVNQPIFLNLLLDGSSYKLNALVNMLGKPKTAKSWVGQKVLAEIQHSEYEGKFQAEIYKFVKDESLSL